MRTVKLKEPLAVVDFSHSLWKNLWLEPGLYKVKEVSNPTGLGVEWLVIEGTKIGIAKPIWQEHLDGRRLKK